ASVRVGLQIPVPRRILVGTGIRGEDQISVAVGLVHHDVGPWLAALGAYRMQDHQRSTLEVAANASVIRTELGDVAFVEVVSHMNQSPRSRRARERYRRG